MVLLKAVVRITAILVAEWILVGHRMVCAILHTDNSFCCVAVALFQTDERMEFHGRAI